MEETTTPVKVDPQQEFLEEYRSLCDKYKLIFSAVPAYVETNHGTFELSIQIRVVPKQ